MNQMPHNPDSLDDELERLLTAGQSRAATPADPLVEAAARLNAAPRPRLSPEAADRIRALTLAAHRAAPKISPVRQLPQQASARFALVAAVGLLLIAVTIFAARSTIQFLSAPPKIDSILTETLTQTPSATPTASSTLPATLPTTIQTTATTSPTAMSPATNTPTPTYIPTTAAPTQTPILPSATATLPLPEVTAEATLPIRISIQGPVQTIEGNLITIFDLTVQLQPNDPVLATLRIGDILRIEGHYVPASQTVVAVQVTRLIAETRESAAPGTPGSAESNPNSSSPETNVNPSSGEVWVDTGDCSNPPPPWAPANGWRRRCESIATPFAQGNGNGSNDNGSGNSNSGGNGNNGNNGNGNGNNGNGNGR